MGNSSVGYPSTKVISIEIDRSGRWLIVRRKVRCESISSRFHCFSSNMLVRASISSACNWTHSFDILKKNKTDRFSFNGINLFSFKFRKKKYVLFWLFLSWNFFDFKKIFVYFSRSAKINQFVADFRQIGNRNSSTLSNRFCDAFQFVTSEINKFSTIVEQTGNRSVFL